MPLVRDQVLLLRRHPWSESSLIVHALSRAHGRVQLIARGAYRAGSRYYAVLDLFDTLDLEWSASPQRELCELRAGDLRTRRQALRRDLRRFRCALAVLELAELAAQPAHDEGGLYACAEEALDALASEDGQPDLGLAAFELGYLEELGLTPALTACAACGSGAPPVQQRPARAAFSAGAGGRLCPACAREARASGRRVGTLPVAVLSDAQALLRGGAASAGAWTGPRIDALRDFVGRFLDYHLETRPRTQRAFLAAPNRNAPAAAGHDATS